MFPLQMRNAHQKISLYQLLLLSCVCIPPQDTNLNLILTILRNIPLVLIHNVFHSGILLLTQVHIILFRHLLLQHIHWYILNITKTLKHREIDNSFKHVSFFNNRIPINSQQFTLFFWVRSDIGSSISRPTSSFGHRHKSKIELINLF